MHLVQFLLVTASITPLALAGPRENTLHRRTGDDDTEKDLSSSAIPLSTGPSLSASSSPSTLPVSFPYGTGNSLVPQSTVEVLTTDIVYTTLTTCPITSTITSGTQTSEEIVTTISTVTRTSTSTICTKCIAPPRTQAETSPASGGVTYTSSLASAVVYSLTQLSAGFPQISSKPEIPGIGVSASPSRGLGFPSVVSVTVSATSATSAFVGFSGYAIVPSPSSTSGEKGPLSNATSTIIPVFTPSLLGNGYGGGFVSTPSVYVSKLLFPNGPSEGVPPGYGFTSQPETFASTSFGSQQSGTMIENITSLSTGLGLPAGATSTLFTGLGLPSSTAFNIGNVTFEVSLPAATPSLIPLLVPIVSASSISATTYTSQLADSSATSPPVTAVIVEGSGFGFAVMGPQGSSNGSIDVEASTAAVATSSTFPATGTQEESLPFTSLGEMPISMSANGAPIFASSSASAASIIAASEVTGAPNPEIAPTYSAPTNAVSETDSAFLSNVPAMPITHTATSDEVIVETSNPPPVFISSVSNFELIITTSTPFPILVNQTASSAEVFVETSTPAPLFLSSANPTATSLAIGSLIAVGVVGSPTSSSGQIGGAPITLAAAPSPEQQGSSSSQPAVAILTPVVGANGLTSLAVVPTPVEQIQSANQLDTPMLTPIVGFNGLMSLAVIPSPVVGANGLTSLAVFSTPVAAASGVASPAVFLTPVVGANGLTSLAVLATPVVGANGLTSLAVGLQGQQGSSGTPSPIEATIPAAVTPTPPVFGPGPVLASFFSTLSATPSVVSGGNSSVHVPLNPSTVAQFEGSALKLSLSIGMALVSFIVFLLYL